jgi:hypothetical protein
MDLSRVAVTVSISILAMSAPAVAQPTFELTLIPSVQTDIGELTSFLVSDFNDKGQAAGRAFESGMRGVAAARYSPGRGVEDLDPNGEYRSDAVAINSKGEVLGFVYGGPTLYEDAFLHSPRSGFDSLEKGKTEEILDGFIVAFPGGELSKSGSILGGDLGLTSDEPSMRPIVYTRRDGWVDVTSIHPRFAELPTFGAFVGDGGHQVFMVSGQTEDGTPQRLQQVFVRLPNGRVEEVVSPGRPVVSVNRPNKRGRMAGLWTTDNNVSQALVFTPAGGAVNIHPDGFKASFATDVSNKGAAVGVAKPTDRFTDVFVHTDSGGLVFVATAEDFKELARGRKGTFKAARPERINNRGEIVGCVDMKKGPDFPFYYSKRHGLVDLKAAVEELDPSLKSDDCAPFLNNKGQILLGVEEGTRITGAIMKIVG